MDLDAVRLLFAQPSGRSWIAIGRSGRNLMRDAGVFGNHGRIVFHEMLSSLLKDWPKELCRRVDKDWEWPDLWKQSAEYLISETQVYGYYESGVCGHPLLKLKNGGQAARLRRRFVGAARGWATDRAMKIGQKGEADLQGGITLELPDCNIELNLAVEVKTPDGSLSKEQALWRDAVVLRGAIHVVATTVEEAVAGIIFQRDAKLRAILRAA